MTARRRTSPGPSGAACDRGAAGRGRRIQCRPGLLEGFLASTDRQRGTGHPGRKLLRAGSSTAAASRIGLLGEHGYRVVPGRETTIAHPLSIFSWSNILHFAIRAIRVIAPAINRAGVPDIDRAYGGFGASAVAVVNREWRAAWIVIAERRPAGHISGDCGRMPDRNWREPGSGPRSVPYRIAMTRRPGNIAMARRLGSRRRTCHREHNGES